MMVLKAKGRKMQKRVTHAHLGLPLYISSLNVKKSEITSIAGKRLLKMM